MEEIRTPQDFTNSMNHERHNFVYSRIDSQEFVTRMNRFMDIIEGSRLRVSNRRNTSKIVLGFRTSKSPSKIVVKYSDRTSGTMMVRNVMKNIICYLPDNWDEPDEEAEQDFLLQRLGIKL